VVGILRCGGEIAVVGASLRPNEALVSDSDVRSEAGLAGSQWRPCGVGV
jgi:hypothetical protein